jgi:hypothetical protein
MSLAFASGQLCLQEWDEPLLADHVVSLLLDLREVSTTTLARPILIIVTRPTAFAKASLPEVLQTALPAILEGCAELISASQCNSGLASGQRRSNVPDHPRFRTHEDAGPGRPRS